MKVLKWVIANILKLDHGVTAEFEIPVQSKLLDFQIQGRSAVMWTLSPDHEGKEMPQLMYRRRFMIVGTNRPVDTELLAYVGTIQEYGPELSWHLFEVRRKD